jgi:hypothetical protein
MTSLLRVPWVGMRMSLPKTPSALSGLRFRAVPTNNLVRPGDYVVLTRFHTWRESTDPTLSTSLAYFTLRVSTPTRVYSRSGT